MTSSPATVIRRFAAYAIDCIVLLLGLAVLQVVLYPVNPIAAMTRAGQPFTPTQLHVWVFATATLPFLLYFALMIASPRQATVGMRIFRVRVERSKGGRLSVARGMARTAVMLLPFELNHALMFHAAPPSREQPGGVLVFGIAAVWLVLGGYIAAMVISPRRQSLHDLAADTVVVAN